MAGERRGVLDACIAPATRDQGGDVLSRSRILAGVNLAGAIVTPFLSLNHYRLGEFHHVVRSGSVWITMLLSLWALRSGVRPSRVGLAVWMVITGVAVSSAFEFVGLSNPPVLALLVVPLFAIFTVGARIGWVFAPISAAAYVALFIHDGTVELTAVAGLFVILTILTACAFFFETQRIHARARLQEALQEAEVARKHAEKKEAEAEFARVEAVRASSAKSQFLANMSHEIRTPMNAVIGMTGLLLGMGLTAEQKSLAEVVRSSGEALLALINDILDFSKIEAGELMVERAPMSVRECTENAAEVLAYGAVQKGLELSLMVEPNVPLAIHGDSTRLQQTLVNLISNAIKFTSEGEIVVSVEAHTRDADGEVEIHFAISDTGIGIPQAKIPGLFDAFVQEDASTTRRFGGTGLGLTICRRLVEAMGGRIWIESELGVGSTFHFTIVGHPAPYVRPRYLNTEHPQLLGTRILVVDDNATNRRILEMQLESWGVEVTLVQSGAEALALLKDGKTFDTGIYDMHMPEMDGLELAIRTRQLPAGAKLPLVMLTSLGQRNHNPGMEYFAVFLTKPAKPSRLYNALLSLNDTDTRTTGTSSASSSALQMMQNVSELDIPINIRILLAEDNTVNQRVAMLSLKRLGLRAALASNGAEAVQALEDIGYDLVLMDVHMPEMDGLEATRRIRKHPTIRQPYIAAVTANATTQDQKLCIDAGMNDYISKPYRIRDLLKMIRRYAEWAAKAGRHRPSYESSLELKVGRFGE